MNWDNMFPQNAIIEKQKEGYIRYRIENEDGFGTMDSYEIFEGVVLIFNNFQTHQAFQGEKAHPGIIEINHCKRGRYECVLSDGRHLNLGVQDLSVSDMGRPSLYSTFILGEYYGLSLMVHPQTATNAIREILKVDLQLKDFFERIIFEDDVLFFRANPHIQHIVTELYEAPNWCRQGYYRIKTLELLLFLTTRYEATITPRAYLCRKDVARIEAVERKMTENLKKHHSLIQLAEEFHMSPTTLKKLFLRVYGETPYHYLRRRRMEEAALMLQTTSLRIGRIAELVGYQNASKFSAAFQEVYGVRPLEYKNGVLLE